MSFARTVYGVIFSAMSGAAFGAAPNVHNLSIETSHGWTFHPAVQNGAVVGFLAEQTSGPTAPAGYEIAWIARTSSGYVLYGYSGVSLSSAAAKLGGAAQVASMMTHTTLTSFVDTESTASYVAMPNGLAITDPLQAVVDALTPETMELLVELGYAQGLEELSAAVIDTQPCGSALNITLDLLAEQTENLIASNGADASLTELSCSLCFPRSWTVTMETPAGPWSYSNAAGGRCNYTRPTTISTIESRIDIFCNLTVTTLPGTTPDSQTISCPGNNSGNCPATPSCNS